MNDRPAVTIEEARQEVERAGHVDVGHIDMPVIVGRQRLHEPGPFLRRFEPMAIQATGPLEHAVGLDGLTATTSASSIMNVSRR